MVPLKEKFEIFFPRYSGLYICICFVLYPGIFSTVDDSRFVSWGWWSYCESKNNFFKILLVCGIYTCQITKWSYLLVDHFFSKNFLTFLPHWRRLTITVQVRLRSRNGPGTVDFNEAPPPPPQRLRSIYGSDVLSK